MESSINPFTPSFGKVPPILAGRKILIGEFEQAFSLNPNDPNLCSLFSGPRGVGKTVLMSHLARKAEASGWISANVTARPGMLEDILERTMDAANEFIERPSFKRLTSLSISSLFSASWEYRNSDSGNWRTRMSRILDVLAEYSIGLLITIDEIDPNLEELIDFSATFQHFVREDRKVALFMAGLPVNVSALLSDKSVSFLRRAAQHQLGRIEDADIIDAFRETIEEAGKSIGDDALSLAAEAKGRVCLYDATCRIPYVDRSGGFVGYRGHSCGARSGARASRFRKRHHKKDVAGPLRWGYRISRGDASRQRASELDERYCRAYG